MRDTTAGKISVGVCVGGRRGVCTHGDLAQVLLRREDDQLPGSVERHFQEDAARLDGVTGLDRSGQDHAVGGRLDAGECQAGPRGFQRSPGPGLRRRRGVRVGGGASRLQAAPGVGRPLFRLVDLLLRAGAFREHGADPLQVAFRLERLGLGQLHGGAGRRGSLGHGGFSLGHAGLRLAVFQHRQNLSSNDVVPFPHMNFPDATSHGRTEARAGRRADAPNQDQGADHVPIFERDGRHDGRANGLDRERSGDERSRDHRDPTPAQAEHRRPGHGVSHYRTTKFTVSTTQGAKGTCTPSATTAMSRCGPGATFSNVYSLTPVPR